MPIVVNSNASATEASFNLSRASEQLRKSLARLSSGDRITRPAEDAGGLAVAYKLDSHAKRTEAVLNNHQNALSYLQLQDGALASVGDIVTRMSELRTMAADVTKNTGDIENYSKEFRELQTQLNQMAGEKFNGISLFAFGNHTGDATSGKELNVSVYVAGTGGIASDRYSYQLLTHPSGDSDDGSISLNVVNIQHITSIGGSGSTLGWSLARGTQTENISDISIETFTEMIQRIADVRAENGAEQQRVQASYRLHSQNLVNLEQARGRIMDTDMALESTRFARYNVLVQASASMTAQANQLTNVALTLLQ
jgi:flagellin